MVYYSTTATQVGGQTTAWISSSDYVQASVAGIADYLFMFQGSRWFDTSSASILLYGFYGFTFAMSYLDISLTQSNTNLYTHSNTSPIRLSSNSFILPAKICPTTYPYYYSPLDLCSSTCLVTAGADYSCTSIPLCPANCDTCPNSTVCTTCSSTYYLRADNLCYSSCLAGTFGSSSNRTCTSCPNGCATCSSLTLCLTCSSSPTSYFLRVDNLCYTTCLNGYYA